MGYPINKYHLYRKLCRRLLVEDFYWPSFFNRRQMSYIPEDRSKSSILSVYCVVEYLTCSILVCSNDPGISIYIYLNVMQET